MTRHHRRTVSDVFNIEVQEDDYASPTTTHQVNFAGTSNKCSPSSSSSDFQNTSDSNFLLRTDSAYRRQYHGPNRMMMAVAAGFEDGEEPDGDLDGVHALEEDEDGDEFDEGGGGDDENDKEGDGGSSQFETSGGTDCSKASRVAVDVSGFVCLLPYIEKGGKLVGCESEISFFPQSFRRWSANFGKSIKNNKRNMYNKTIRFMPSRLQKSELP